MSTRTDFALKGAQIEYCRNSRSKGRVSSLQRAHTDNDILINTRSTYGLRKKLKFNNHGVISLSSDSDNLGDEPDNNIIYSDQ